MTALDALNSAQSDDDPSLSPDLLEIYFASTRDGVEDIYVATRPSLDAPWGEPAPVTGLGPNPAGGRGGPAVSPAGTTLFFSQNLGGDIDIFVATRPNLRSPFSDPVAVDDLNTNGDEFAAAPTADLLTIVFSRNSGAGADLFLSKRPAAAAAWSRPQSLLVLNSPGEDATPWIDPAATVVMFSSDRPDGGPKDIYVSFRADADSAWATPTAVDSLNTPADEQDPWFSADGHTVFFASGPNDQNQDLYTATR